MKMKNQLTPNQEKAMIKETKKTVKWLKSIGVGMFTYSTAWDVQDELQNKDENFPEAREEIMAKAAELMNKEITEVVGTWNKVVA